MDLLRNVYPPLDERAPLPGFYIPAIYATYFVTLLLPYRNVRILTTLPLLFALVIVFKPYFTAGSAGDDYGISANLIIPLVLYVDFLILSMREGEPVRFTSQLIPTKKDAGISEEDCTTTREKAKWTLRLITTQRGIGWNVQVNGVPNHPNAQAARWVFVRKSAWKSALCVFRRYLSSYMIGLAITAGGAWQSSAMVWVWKIFLGWAGGSWTYNGLRAFYDGTAAVTVALGICEPWEWPPIFGALSEAWSVRQMWSIVWHQLLRRCLQQPGIRLARLFGLQKGTLGSRYLQLYVAFGISLLVHEWGAFNAARRDMGEFWFFAAQPVIITIEDFAQWLWRNYGPSQRKDELDVGARLVGYLWTFAWFSYCLPPIIEEFTKTGTVANGLGEPFMKELGRQTVVGWLR